MSLKSILAAAALVLCTLPALAQQRFVIECDILGASKMSPEIKGSFSAA